VRGERLQVRPRVSGCLWHRGNGFVPMVFAGGSSGDTHKLDDAYPVGAGKLVGGTRDRPGGFVPPIYASARREVAEGWLPSLCILCRYSNGFVPSLSSSERRGTTKEDSCRLPMSPR